MAGRRPCLRRGRVCAFRAALALSLCSSPMAARELRAPASDDAFAHPAPLTEGHCRRSRALEGRLGAAAGFAGKLELCEGGPLTVIIFGGSITFGSNSFDQWAEEASPSYPLLRASSCWDDRSLVKTGSACWEVTYGFVLERRLNAAFPCADGARHQVHSMRRKGRGSAYHLQTLRDCTAYATGARGLVGQHYRDLKTFCEHLFAADIVLVDTAINDSQETQLNTEKLARELLRLPSGPALYWLVATITEHHWKTGATPPYYEEANGEKQAEVLEYYGLSQISLPKALAADLAYEGGRDRWKPFWSRDQKHPSAWGHTILADLVLCNLRRDAADVGRASPSDLLADASPHHEPMPWFVDARDETLSFVAAPLIDAYVVEKVAVGGDGFVFMEDVPGKPGLVAMAVGSDVLLQPLAIQSAHAKCEFVLTYLISYEHMGVMNAEVLLGWKEEPDAGASGDCDVRDLDLNAKAAYSELIDGLTLESAEEDRVSIAHEHRLAYAVPAHYQCAWLRVTVVPAEHWREVNKVKLLALTTVCPSAANAKP